MPGTGFSPTLTCSFCWQARHYHPHRHHRCHHHDHQHPPLASGWWWQFRPSSIFLALLSRCLWPVLDTRSLSTAETQVVQMEGDSRRLPRCAGGQLNLWPQLAQLEQWIELRALSVSVSALTACALPPPPRENFLKNVHIQRGRLGCRVASFSRWRLFLANP